VRGGASGLVLGLVWGIWEEKKFVLRNVLRVSLLSEL
jgi:hypothetical protein